MIDVVSIGAAMCCRHGPGPATIRTSRCYCDGRRRAATTGSRRDVGREAVWWRRVNEWAYAQPTRWGALVASSWALGWMIGMPLVHERIPSTLLSAVVGGPVVGVVVELVTRRAAPEG